MGEVKLNIPSFDVLLPASLQIKIDDLRIRGCLIQDKELDPFEDAFLRRLRGRLQSPREREQARMTTSS